MTLPTVTVDGVLCWAPCWSEEAIRRVAGSRENWNALDVLALPNEKVPPAERLWVVLRPQMLPPAILQAFVLRCVTTAMMHADLATRSHVPHRLDTAGLHEQAATLRALAPIHDEETASVAISAVIAAADAARSAEATRAAISAVIAAADAARSAEATRAAIYDIDASACNTASNAAYAAVRAIRSARNTIRNARDARVLGASGAAVDAADAADAAGTAALAARGTEWDAQVAWLLLHVALPNAQDAGVSP